MLKRRFFLQSANNYGFFKKPKRHSFSNMKKIEVSQKSGHLQPKEWQMEPELGRQQATCRIPGQLLNETRYSVNLLLVENGNLVTQTIEDAVAFEIKDLKPRVPGSWHGQEPGPVRPRLYWSGQ